MWKLTLGEGNSSFHELEINSEFGKPFVWTHFLLCKGPMIKPHQLAAACQIHEEISSTSTTSHFNLSFEVYVLVYWPCLPRQEGYCV